MARRSERREQPKHSRQRPLSQHTSPPTSSFSDSLARSIAMGMAVQMSKDANGRPDPYKAAGMVAGAKGGLSISEQIQLTAMLGSQGAFDD